MTDHESDGHKGPDRPTPEKVQVTDAMAAAGASALSAFLYGDDFELVEEIYRAMEAERRFRARRARLQAAGSELPPAIQRRYLPL